MKILYLSNSKLPHSVNNVYIKGLRENGVTVEAHQIPKGWAGFGQVKNYCRSVKDVDLMMIGYDSPWLVIFSKLFSKNKVIYNALCSVYERLIVARSLASKYSLKAFYYRILDSMSFNLADKVMLETNSQIEYCNQMFFVPRSKCIKALTGVNEDDFIYNSKIVKLGDFTTVFRGMLVPESGGEYVVRAAKKLENKGVNFVMITGGQEMSKIQRLVDKLRPSNLKVINEFMPSFELNQTMQSFHLNLGQLSSHERLKRTIPHKAFESSAMKLPYLTAANRGVLELLEDGKNCITFEPGNSDSLAEKILWAKNNPDELEKIAGNGYELFKEKLTPKILAGELLINLRSLND